MPTTLKRPAQTPEEIGVTGISEPMVSSPTVPPTLQFFFADLFSFFLLHFSTCFFLHLLKQIFRYFCAPVHLITVF